MGRWLNYKERWREVVFSVFHVAPGISSRLTNFISVSKQMRFAYLLLSMMYSTFFIFYIVLIDSLIWAIMTSQNIYV
jgi:hypothetical protein